MPEKYYFKLLLGLYTPQKGNVLINGQPADALSENQRRKIISCVEQNFSMVPGTILDQITLFDPDITLEQAQTAAGLTGLDEVIRSFPEGYNTPCKPGLFSQGQWQLLSIARAVATNPRILLLDEITANLDADTEQTVLSALNRAGNGRTVLSISHRLYEKWRTADCDLTPAGISFFSCRMIQVTLANPTAFFLYFSKIPLKGPPRYSL